MLLPTLCLLWVRVSLHRRTYHTVSDAWCLGIEHESDILRFVLGRLYVRRWGSKWQES